MRDDKPQWVVSAACFLAVGLFWAVLFLVLFYGASR